MNIEDGFKLVKWILLSLCREEVVTSGKVRLRFNLEKGTIEVESDDRMVGRVENTATGFVHAVSECSVYKLGITSEDVMRVVVQDLADQLREKDLRALRNIEKMFPGGIRL